MYCYNLTEFIGDFAKVFSNFEALLQTKTEVSLVDEIPLFSVSRTEKFGGQSWDFREEFEEFEWRFPLILDETLNGLNTDTERKIWFMCDFLAKLFPYKDFFQHGYKDIIEIFPWELKELLEAYAWKFIHLMDVVLLRRGIDLLYYQHISGMVLLPSRRIEDYPEFGTQKALQYIVDLALPKKMEEPYVEPQPQEPEVVQPHTIDEKAFQELKEMIKYKLNNSNDVLDRMAKALQTISARKLKRDYYDKIFQNGERMMKEFFYKCAKVVPWRKQDYGWNYECFRKA